MAVSGGPGAAVSEEGAAGAQGQRDLRADLVDGVECSECLGAGPQQRVVEHEGQGAGREGGVLGMESSKVWWKTRGGGWGWRWVAEPVHDSAIRVARGLHPGMM